MKGWLFHRHEGNRIARYGKRIWMAGFNDCPYDLDAGILKTAPAVFSLTVVDLVIMAWCVTFLKLGTALPILVPIAAYTALLAVIGALWCAASFILNPAFGKEILPLGKKLMK